jgi:hypothetical protein
MSVAEGGAVELDRQLRDAIAQVGAALATLRSTPTDTDAWQKVRGVGTQGFNLAHARVETGVPLPDMRYPTGRPGFLGEYQPWPCGRCGNEVDDSERHDCQPTAEPVVLPPATKPLIGPGSIDGGK